MPDSEMNHAVPSPPVSNSYGGLSYEKYATYNVNNTVVSYTNFSTTISQPVISVASSRRDFDPFGNNAANTESLRVEELIPEQLRASSENFVSLIKDYYEHLNTVGLPTYETNRIIDEHDIDKVSEKYLDGIQGEIAKNIPDSAVMDRVSLYKKIVQYYTLKGSEESITTFFRLFFDEIIQVSYPREKLLEPSSGNWVKKNDDFTQTITTSASLENLGTDYERTSFSIVDGNNAILGQATIRTIETTERYTDSPRINGLSIDLDSKKSLNASNETWDSTLFKKPIRGRFMQGTRFNDLQKLIKLDGKRAYVDFGIIGNNPKLSLDGEEHTFVIRTFPKFSKENTELQPLFSLSENYSDLNSHELFFNSTTNKLGRSFVDTKEPTITLNPNDSESLIFSNFIDETTSDLTSILADGLDKYNHMDDFLSSVGRTYNGRWIKSLIPFNSINGNNLPVYLHETDPVLSILTLDDLKYYKTDGTTFSGPDNLKIGQTIYGESINDFSGVNALSEDGFVVAIGASGSDDGGINSGSVRVYELGNAKVDGLVNNSNEIELKDMPQDFVLETNMVVSGGGLPELGAADAVRISSIVSGGTSADTTAIIRVKSLGQNINVTLNDNTNLRIGENANVWYKVGQDIDGSNPGDILGSALSLNAAGNILAIGAPKLRGANVVHDNLPYKNYLGEVKIYELNSSEQWVAKGTNIVGVDENSRIGASVSLNGVGDRLAFGSGANPNIDYDLGTEESMGLLLEDFNGFGGVYGHSHSAVTSFVFDNRTYTKTLVSTTPQGFGQYDWLNDDDLGHEIMVEGDSGESGSPAFSAWVNYETRLITSGSNAGGYSNVITHEFSRVTDGDTHGYSIPAYPWLNIDGTFNSDISELSPNPVPTLVANGTSVTITAGAENEFNTSATHVLVSGVSHQYDGLFEISSITSTAITYIRSGPTLTSNSYSLQTGINPQFGEIDGGKHIGIRVPDRIKNDTEIYEWKEADAINDPGVYSWIQIGENIVSENNDPLTGTNVKLSDDGRTAMVGTHIIDDSGIANLCVRIYYNEDKSYTAEEKRWNQIGGDHLFAPSTDKSEIAMSLSNDGTIFAVGIVGDGTDEGFKGQVETYQLRTTVNTQEYIKLGQTIEGEGVGDECGKSVNLNTNGNVLVIGYPGNEDNGNDAGQVQVFVYNSSMSRWQKAGAAIEGFGALDNTGESVSINGTGTRVTVASPGDDSAGQNRGKVETFQIPLDVTINSFTLSEKNITDNTFRWAIKYEDDIVYYTDWYTAAEFENLNPYGVKTKWNIGNKQGDKSLPVLPHCDYIKRNNNHLFNLHNRGYLSIFYKRNGNYQPLQNITIGDTETYDEERLWDILDYAVDGTHLVLLDRPINGASRLVIFKLDQYNHYQFHQTVSLNLPATHLGSADFAHVKINAEQIVVGTHTFNNIDIAQVIQIYSKPIDYWSTDEYITLPSVVNTAVEADLLFDINKNVTASKWTSTNNLVNLESDSIVENTSKDSGILVNVPRSTSGSGLGFNIENNFSLSLRFKTGNLFSTINDILTIGNITLRIAVDTLNNKKSLQVLSHESGNVRPVFLNKIDSDIILDNDELEIFSDEYFDSEIKPGEWNNLILEFELVNDVVTGLRYSINGFKRSKSVALKSNSPVHGITAASQIKLYNNNAFSHIAFYNKKLSYLEFNTIQTNLSIDYTETVTTGINSLLDGGRIELSETGTVIIKASTYGIHIWERLSIGNWKSYYNTAQSITSGDTRYFTHNGSRSHSFKFFGNDLLLVGGGLNNSKQYVDQFNLSNAYNKEHHNSRSKLYYIRSQYSTSASGWKIIPGGILRPTISFSQSNTEDFKVGLNYGANIAIDNDTDSFAISLEPNSVNAVLNGPDSISNSSARATTVKYDIWRKLANNRIQAFPVNEPDNGFPVVESYFRRLNKSAVVKLLDKPLSYNAVISYPDIIHSTSTENPLMEYSYDAERTPLGYHKTANEYKPDFVISTAPSPEIYLDTNTVTINEYNVIAVKAKADRYNGYVKISCNGSDFDQGTIIQGNTLNHLTVSQNSNLSVGRKGGNYFNGDISHAQYYTKAISNESNSQVVTYFANNVKKFYKIVFDDLVGKTSGAVKITSLPDASKPFVFEDLDGHTFNSFLYYDTPEYKLDSYDADGNLIVGENTQIRIKANYGNNKAPEEVVYWGDGRLDPIHNRSNIRHTYTLKYLGEYSNKKGRVSSVNRLQDSEYWQKFSYVIRSGLKITDWENSFLSLVHPAGLKFFASVILLVIRDNHWFGPKSIIFDPATRQNVSLLRVEDQFLAPFRTNTPLEDMRWLEALTAPSESGGYHMPMFQPGWLQGDIRTREFIFEAGLWTRLARSVPGNEAAAKYTFEYFEEDQDDGDVDFRIIGNYDNGSWETEVPVAAASATTTTTIQIKDVPSSFNLAVGMVLEGPAGSGIPAGTTIAAITTEGSTTATIEASQAVSLSENDAFTIYSNVVGSIVQQIDDNGVITGKGIIASFAQDGDDFTGIIRLIGGLPVPGNGQMFTEDRNSSDTGPQRTGQITTVPIKKKADIVNVYGDEEQDAAYLLQDRSTTNFNSEMFLRAVLTTFKYVIPALVPQREFTKRDYEQNLKFKDHDDISSYLPVTIKDALAERDVFMNIGATITKINQLDTEGGAGFYIESDTSNPLNDQLLIDDHITNWWNNPLDDQDVSAPVAFSIDSYNQGGEITTGDFVYQDKIISGETVRIQGLVVSHEGDLSDRILNIGWRGAYNISTSTVLSSNPEATQLFETGVIFTLDESNNQEDIANVTLNT
jgi:hypothetical protein